MMLLKNVKTREMCSRINMQTVCLKLNVRQLIVVNKLYNK